MKIHRLLPLLPLLASTALARPSPDQDSDGTWDLLDVCLLEPQVPAPIGCDTDMDGYGNGCDADLNNDTLIGGAEFSQPGPDNDFLDCFIAGADPNNLGCDINCDGLINSDDFISATRPDFLDGYRIGTPGPSGLPCAGTVPCP